MSDWPSYLVDTNGIRLHYHRSGGGKTPLILSHGITDSGLCWTRVARILEKDYDLIMVDARGHGLSSAPEDGYTLVNHVADLAGLIRALGLKRPCLMGHSMGAEIVATLAANHPDLVKCAVLEDPPWLAESSASWDEERQERLEEWRASIRETKAKHHEEIVTAGKKEYPSWAEIEFDPWAEAQLRVNPDVLEFSQRRRDWRSTVAKITCPTLLITAEVEAGAIVTPETARAVTKLQPHIKVAHIAGAGHNIRREGFEKFMEVITAFLQSQR